MGAGGLSKLGSLIIGKVHNRRVEDRAGTVGGLGTIYLVYVFYSNIEVFDLIFLGRYIISNFWLGIYVTTVCGVGPTLCLLHAPRALPHMRTEVAKKLLLLNLLYRLYWYILYDEEEETFFFVIWILEDMNFYFNFTNICKRELWFVIMFVLSKS